MIGAAQILGLAARASVAAADGQFGFDPTPPAALPKPPTVEAWLFEHTWTLPAVLVGVGVVALAALNRSGKAKAGLWALAGCVLAAGGAFALSKGVVTEREQLRAVMEELVAAVAEADVNGVDRLLDSDAVVEVTPIGMAIDRASVLQRVRAEMTGRYEVEDYRTGSVQAVVDGPNAARTQARVVASTTEGQRAGTWWLINWRRGRDDGVWRAYLVECVRIDPGGLL